MIGVEVDRLIDLINDILKLSELESVTIPQSEELSLIHIFRLYTDNRSRRQPKRCMIGE